MIQDVCAACRVRLRLALACRVSPAGARDLTTIASRFSVSGDQKGPGPFANTTRYAGCMTD